MKLKKKITNIIADVVLKIAIRENGAASMLGTYQPKEPEALKKLKK